MKTAALIQARLGSSRLPGKVLHKINGKPLLQIMVDRLKRSKTLNEIIVVTTGSPADDPIVKFCEDHKIFCFRGSEKDVLDRYYRAAKQFNVDVVARLTSDCPLADPAVVDQVIQTYLDSKGSYDFVANNVPTPGTYPDGMDVEVFPFKTLEEAWRDATKPSEREHVTFYVWKQPGKFRLFRIDLPKNYADVRLTVDYPDDLGVIEALVNHFEKNRIDGNLKEIIEFIDKNPSLINKNHVYGEGWKPSLEKDVKQGEADAQKAPPLKLVETEKAWAKALKVIPGGAQTFSKSPAQYVKGAAPSMLLRGRGSKVWDLDGNEYIDYTLSLGPVILGHSHPEVNAVAAACANDYFNAPSMAHPLETKFAEKITSLIPSAEMVRFGKNGSDATAGAVRLARAYTNREVIATCGYHGWQDWFIGSTSRKRGVPRGVQALTKPFTYNKLETLEKIFNENPDNVAAVIMEPVNFFPPEKNFLEKVKELCRSKGALLIFDETITGFRIDMGGAQKFFNVLPDLSTFGKAVGNGYPVSILCGRADVMKQLEEVFFSFTFGGELPSIAAALKTIEILETENGIARIAAAGKKFKDGFNKIVSDLNLPFVSCIGLDFWPEYIFKAIPEASAEELLTLLQQEVVRKGVLTRSAPFMSLSHSNADIDETLRVFRDGLAVVAQAVKEKKVGEWIDGEIIQPVIRATIQNETTLAGGRSSFN